MEIFHAGVSNKNLLIKFYEKTGKKINILKNYYEFTDNDFKKEIFSFKPYVNKIMLDSGAFSANTHLSPKEAEMIKCRYPIFLKQHSDFLQEYVYSVFTYDFRFDAEGYMENYFLYLELMEAYKDICPVIHRFTFDGINIETQKYLSFNPPTIAVGQIISEQKRVDRTSKTNIINLQNTINSIKNNKSNCHLLGITKIDALIGLYNYDTCDSKSWLDYAKTGNVQIFWAPDDTGKNSISQMIHIPQYLKNIDKKHSIYRIDAEYKTRFFDEMKKELGLEEKDFNNSSSTESLQLANLYYSLKLMDYINSGITQLDISATTTKQDCQVNFSPIKNENPFANANKRNIQPYEGLSEIKKFTENPFK